MAGILIETSVTPPILIDAGELIGGAAEPSGPPTLATRLLAPKVTIDAAPLLTKTVAPAGEPIDWRIGALIAALAVVVLLGAIGWIARRL